MKVIYTLNLDDHLAWFEYFRTTDFGRHQKSRLPFIGNLLNRLRRTHFARGLMTPQNSLALGERSLELTAEGVREIGEGYEFTHTWPEYVMVETTTTHLFIAHASMNAHIVPLCAFSCEEDQNEFILYAKARGRIWADAAAVSSIDEDA